MRNAAESRFTEIVDGERAGGGVDREEEIVDQSHRMRLPCLEGSVVFRDAGNARRGREESGDREDKGFK